MGKNLGNISVDSEDLYNSPAEYRLIKEEFLCLIQQFTPGLYLQGQELFDRISTRNWALEWGLPRWLGEAFELPETVIHELTLSNVLLLGFVRIIDDVVDEDFQPSEKTIDWASTKNIRSRFKKDKRNQAILLGVLLQSLWYKHHVNLLCNALPRNSSKLSYDNELVSNYLNSEIKSLSEWINATSDEDRRPFVGFSSFDETEYIKIGHRFSLLKTCCVVTCSIAGRDKEIPSLTRAIDNILTSAVMIDDIFDWSNDLQTGRYNVFIAFCSDLPQVKKFQNKNELSVLRAIYLDKKLEPYFELILERLSIAEKVLTTTSPKLSKFISCLKSDVCTSMNSLKMMTQAQMREACDRFLNGSFVKP